MVGVGKDLTIFPIETRWGPRYGLTMTNERHRIHHIHRSYPMMILSIRLETDRPMLAILTVLLEKLLNFHRLGIAGIDRCRRERRRWSTTDWKTNESNCDICPARRDCPDWRTEWTESEDQTIAEEISITILISSMHIQLIRMITRISVVSIEGRIGVNGSNWNKRR